ncbi:TetR/AcrR family transcriptional regulator [Salegentibacter salegens]|uniref:Transcriptional regulator, TetR family n=1 Tax=Salegentibacter salegens TaxID=143223 RepID=A0A1M7J072_9FLAO|nr:helix-turn-helix domain-containing protein [Salegentibacter salegens]PRX49876.1 TetR family transcriptional regulator [Salegentibacter salegens]SHM46371.1 transcriptional regulator, TetR family [Salegentibacter salegens]
MPRVKLFDENEVLTKAMNLFWKQGYSATSVQDLVVHLGISRASLYDTFGDKQQLFKKSFELYRKQSFEKTCQFFQNQPNVKEGFSELFKNAIHEAVLDKDRKGCFAVNNTTELVPNDESCLEILSSNRRDFENLFYEYLKKGQKKGQLKECKDLQSLASFLYITYNGILVVSKINPNKKELTNSANLALSLLV